MSWYWYPNSTFPSDLELKKLILYKKNTNEAMKLIKKTAQNRKVFSIKFPKPIHKL